MSTSWAPLLAATLSVLLVMSWLRNNSMSNALAATTRDNYNSESTTANRVTASERLAPMLAADNFVRNSLVTQQAPKLSQAASQFDATQFKSIYEAIKAHPDLREFANLCESRGVKEIAAMDKTQLTIFAPIDKALADLLAKSKARSINLIDLAKHHMAQGLVTPDDNLNYPHQFQSYALLSPLYLNQVHGHTTSAGLYVNNARILATYHIQIDPDTYQALHLIDEPLEFAYVNRRTHLVRAQQNAPQAVGSGTTSESIAMTSSSSSARHSTRVPTNRKQALNLDDLIGVRATSELGEQASGAVSEFYERFGDVLAHQLDVDLYHTRALHQSANSWQREPLPTADTTLSFDKLARFLSLPTVDSLRAKLYNLNESNTFNTYFLPIESDELNSLLSTTASGNQQQQLAVATLHAHIIPNEVLFTRTMRLGELHASSASSVELSLVKTLPASFASYNYNDTFDQNQQLVDDTSEKCRRLASSPLLVQARTSRSSSSSEERFFQNGLTQAEIVIANIPLSNGVLHLIKRPLVVQQRASLLDYINDNENKLTNVARSLGSHSAAATPQSVAASPRHRPVVELSRFRELLARGDRQVLARLSQRGDTQITILAPDDNAFRALRYDLRALISGDEQLIPSHWDVSYRQDLLERLLKRHIIEGQALTSDTLGDSSTADAAATQQQTRVSSLNGQQLSLTRDNTNGNIRVECAADLRAPAHVLQRDLIAGSSGVLHIIDRVLGEEQETIYSLLESLVVKFDLTSTSRHNGQLAEVSRLVEKHLLDLNHNHDHDDDETSSNKVQHHITTNSDSLSSVGEHQTLSAANQHEQRKHSGPELSAVRRALAEHLASEQAHTALATSVNISFHLAKLVSRAESRDDWNEKFKLQDTEFTYFVPTDLAWLQLAQAQPQLYKPLVYFLEQPTSTNNNNNNNNSPIVPTTIDELDNSSKLNELNGTLSQLAPRSSESSHRLLQILERHLIANRRVTQAQLNQLDRLQTIGGTTVRLIEQQQQQVASSTQMSSSDGHTHSAGTFAALHTIISGMTNSAPSISSNEQLQQQQQLPLIVKKSLKLSNSNVVANVVQAHETSNGLVYLIDNVLIAPDDSDYIIQTSSTPAISSKMSSLLGAHNSALLDFFQNILSYSSSSSSSTAFSAGSMLTLIASLTLAIIVLTLVALVLVVRRHRRNKLNRHQQLESGLTSSSSANSGSTSTTKSL